MFKIFTFQKFIISACLFIFLTSGGKTLHSQWIEVNPMPTEFRTHHSFAFGINGTGYIVSGFNNALGEGNSARFYSYNPETDEWTRKDDFPGGERSFAIGEAYKNKAYFGFGRNGGNLNDLWEFDPLTDKWTELPACPCTPRIHPALTIVNDQLIVGMGSDEDGNTNDFWMYDIPSMTWKEIAPYPSGTRHHPFQFSVDGFHYVGLGHGSALIYQEWYKYNAVADEWEEMASLPGEGRVAGTQFAHNGKGYVLSGEGDDHDFMETGEFWEYDPVLDVWTELPPHPGKSRWAPASFILDNEVYVINGSVYNSDIGGYEYIDEVYKYALSETTSTKKIEQVSFEINPNPASDELILDIEIQAFQNAKVVIYNMAGERIFQSDFSQKINISQFLTGMYVVHVISDKQLLNAKFQKL